MSACVVLSACVAASAWCFEQNSHIIICRHEKAMMQEMMELILQGAFDRMQAAAALGRCFNRQASANESM